MFAVYLEQCSPAAINQIQSLGEKRGATERGRARAKEDDGGCGGDRDAAAAADEEEEGKSERAAERERGGSICECTRRHMIYGGEKRIEPKRANIQNYVLHNIVARSQLHA